METARASTVLALPKKRLGHSTVHVTELSFGAAGIGDLRSLINDAAAYGAVDAAGPA